MKEFYLSIIVLSLAINLTSCGGGGGNPAAEAAVALQDAVTPSGSGVDPYYAIQWHLVHDLGYDLNVLDAWDDGYTGTGVTVAVVDDGIEIAHPDLSANIASGKSYNYRTGTTDPTPPAVADSNYHGTAVAGVIAAVANNAIGGMGVAPNAKLAGFNLLCRSVSSNYCTGSLSTADIVDAMLCHDHTDISVSNNSWGNFDDLGTFDQPDADWQSAIDEGLITGRDGKGLIYVWAAGNGGRTVDRSSYDGYVNHMGIIPVCGVGDDDGKVSYSEQGANLWICGPTDSVTVSSEGIVTTDYSGGTAGANLTAYGAYDLSDRSYTAWFNGTSASAPMVSGVVALMLQANPNLGWRDVKIILAKSARKNDALDSSWSINGATPPYNISHKYGFGVADASNAVGLAKIWTTNVGALQTSTYTISNIADFYKCNNLACSATTPNVRTIAADMYEIRSDKVVAGSGISNIEFVEVTVNITYVDWGNLTLILERTGAITTSSVLMETHQCYDSGDNHVACSVSGNTFTFATTRHLGEPADGTWRLRVKNAEGADVTGPINSWVLKIKGT